MLTIEQLDWNQLWRTDRKTNSKARDRDFWNRRAPSFANHARSEGNDDYVVPFLRLIDPKPDWTVLDVGCGGGTLAHPLAKVVRHVTAMDFSPVMIELLNKRSEELDVRNIDAKVAAWQDDWCALGIGQHDIAIASRSLISESPRDLLIKLTAFAKKFVFISCPVGSGPADVRVLEAVGREAPRNPDYIYIYNLLHQMGIYANVSVIEKSPRIFVDSDEAVNSLRWMLDPITPAEEEALRRFVDAHLIAEEGGWRLKGESHAQWSVIWWKASNGSSR